MSVTPQPTVATSRRRRLISGKRLERIVPAAVAIWPFMFHAPVAFRVWHGGFQHIGNDFPLLYYPYKPSLLAAMAHGSVPLWMPQEAGGFPFALNPFTQSLYPGNLIVLPVARLLGHWGPLEHQWYALAAVSVLALSVYLFLRKVGLSLLPAALAAVVVASSYKVTDTLRFPNATHAIACASVAVLAIAYLRVTRRVGARIGLAALLALSIFSLATAGYPYFFVYFFLVLPPLLLWLELGAPGSYRAQRIGFGAYAGTVVASIGVAVVAVWPYISGMRSVLAETTDRHGGDWAYSTGHRFDGFAYVASLVLPDRSSFEGWFYFGTAGLVVVALAVDIVARDEGLRRHSRLIATTGLWFAWIVFFGLNASNPLFRFAWETLPVIDTMRVWGRINIFLVFPLAIVLGLSLEVLVRRYAGERLLGPDARRAAVVAALVALAVVAVQLGVAVARPADPEFVASLQLGYVPTDPEYVLFTVAIAVLLACAVRVMQARGTRPLRRVQALCAVFAFVWLWQIHGAAPWSWMWITRPDASNASTADVRVGRVSFAQLAEGAARTERTPPTGSPVFNAAAPWATAVYANWHFSRYVRFLHDRRISDDARKRLLGVTSPSRLFFAAGSPDAGALERGAVKLRAPRAADVEHYDGSRLIATVAADEPGALVFADNWDRGWSATVDGRRVPIERAFGTFKAVRIPRGTSRVEFSYCPFSAPVYRALC